MKIYYSNNTKQSPKGESVGFLYMKNLVNEKEKILKYSERKILNTKNEKYQNFSLTHSEDMIFAIISENKIGIDCEKLKKRQNLNYLKFFKREQPKNLFEFYKLWTIKEAVLKLNGVGIEKMKSTLVENERVYFNNSKYYYKIIIMYNHIIAIVQERPFSKNERIGFIKNDSIRT